MIGPSFRIDWPRWRRRNTRRGMRMYISHLTCISHQVSEPEGFHAVVVRKHEGRRCYLSSTQCTRSDAIQYRNTLHLTFRDPYSKCNTRVAVGEFGFLWVSLRLLKLLEWIQVDVLECVVIIIKHEYENSKYKNVPDVDIDMGTGCERASCVLACASYVVFPEILYILATEWMRRERLEGDVIWYYFERLADASLIRYSQYLHDGKKKPIKSVQLYDVHQHHARTSSESYRAHSRVTSRAVENEKVRS